MRACRGGGKTITFAAIYVLDSVFKAGYSIVHIGGTEQQSKQGYAYFAGDPDKEGFHGFMRRPQFEAQLSSSLLTKTVLKNHSNLEIRTGGSSKSVSGPHPNMLGVDELDHIDMGILETALLMPISRGAYGAQTLMGSSQYTYYGTLQALMQKAASRGVKTYEYDLFDVLRSCGRDYPKECEDCPFYRWTNPFTGENEELCNGRGTKSDGHYSYQDAIDKYLMTTDVENFALQMFLLRGTSQSLVYPMFNEAHVRPFPPDGADLSKWKCFAGVDMWSRGRVVVLAQAPGVLSNGKRATWVAAEWADDNSSTSKVKSAAFDMREKMRRDYGLNLNVFWMEAAAGEGTASEWKESGLPARLMPPEKRNVLYGVSQVRDAFLDSLNIASLFIDPSCEALISSLGEQYHCKRNPDGSFDRDTPGKEGEDSADALRYAYVGGPILIGHLQEQEVRPGLWDMSAADQQSRWAAY